MNATPSLLKFYRRAPLGQRVFLGLRARLTPYAQMATLLPTEGEILDLACGHGLLSLTAAWNHPGRRILGVDHARERVEAAQSAARSAGLPSARFEEGSLLDPPRGPFDAIAVIDSLHYLPRAEQEALIARLAGSLRENGLLMIREVDPEGARTSRLNRLYERFSTTVGITRSNAGTDLHFRSPAEWAQLLAAQGLQVKVEPCSHPLFADVLILGHRGHHPDGAHRIPGAGGTA